MALLTLGHGASLTFQHPGSSASADGSKNKRLVSIDEVVDRAWSPHHLSFSWETVARGHSGNIDEEETWLIQKVQAGGSAGGPFLRARRVPLRNHSDSDLDQIPITQVLVDQPQIDLEGGQALGIEDAWPSPDLQRVLVVSNRTTVWRHSFTGLYWIIDLASNKTQPLDSEVPFERIQLARWSPRADAVAFVRGNNMFLRRLVDDTSIAMTQDGNNDVIYGIPDWVYEEEVFEDNTAFWWSPDGRHIAFLRTDERPVGEYSMQYFVAPDPQITYTYPSTKSLRYPRTGWPNPIVSLRVYDTFTDSNFEVDMPDEFTDTERVIFLVLWLTSDRILVKQTNRESDVLKVFCIHVPSKTSSLVRSENIRALDGGWVETTRSTKPIPADPSKGRPADGYVDTIIHDGYNHLAYFTPPAASEPATVLTSGKWQVVDAPAAVDLQHNSVYFLATIRSPTERTLCAVGLDGREFKEVAPLPSSSEPAYYGVDFSPRAEHAILTYHGSGIPFQSLVTLSPGGVVGDIKLEENSHLAETIMQDLYDFPQEIYHTIPVRGDSGQLELSVVERLPPGFNSLRRYPTIFYMYGGPGSQTVNCKFKVDFQTYLASRGYVVVTVDGRGTGFHGRSFQCIVRDRIGHFEALDQIAVGNIWKRRGYVDVDRMAVWGWSFGGFLTLKVLEMDAGETFQYGMAVAPVTDWRYYGTSPNLFVLLFCKQGLQPEEDSIHTERHMHTPEHNEAGYKAAAISNMTALNQTVRFMISHGTADDNVHIQNTFSLVDRLNSEGVTNYDLFIYPDSGHDIVFHNAERIIYQRLANWLAAAFSRAT